MTDNFHPCNGMTLEQKAEWIADKRCTAKGGTRWRVVRAAALEALQHRPPITEAQVEAAACILSKSLFGPHLHNLDSGFDYIPVNPPNRAHMTDAVKRALTAAGDAC